VTYSLVTSKIPTDPITAKIPVWGS